jgi:uncharacterized membrane protein
MNVKHLTITAFILVMMAVMTVSATALPVIEQIRINGDVFEHGDQLVLMRGDDIDVRVRISAMEDEQNVEVIAEILGYEYTDRESVLFARAPLFDLQAGDVAFRTLSLTLPTRMDRDHYDLRVRVGSRTGPAEEYLFRIRLTGERNRVVIQDITFNPSEVVTSGRALLAQVRVENIGDRVQRDVLVRVSLEGTQAAASVYMDDIQPDRTRSSEDLFLRIPDCLPSGRYNVVAEVTYDRGYATERLVRSINVVTDEELCAQIGLPAEGRVTMVLSSPEAVEQGERVLVPVVISNDGTTARTVMVDVRGVADWATARVSPSSVLVVPAKGTTTAYITLDVAGDAPAGAQIASVTLTDSVGTTLAQASVPVEVREGEDNGVLPAWDWRRILEISLLVLVVVLIILGIVIAISRMRSDRDDDEGGSQAYY